MDRGLSAASGPAESLLALQAFIGLTAVMALTLAAAVTGRRESESALRNYSVEMEQLALTDELTGLRNRRGFLVLADQALRMSRRTRAKCALVFIDLDGLKRMNDTRGHAAGDALIADAAGVIGRVFRESDVVGRVGGDEFADVRPARRARRRHRRFGAAAGRDRAVQLRRSVPTCAVAMSVGTRRGSSVADTRSTCCCPGPTARCRGVRGSALPVARWRRCMR